MQLQRRKVQARERSVNNSMVPEVTFEVLLEDEVASFASNEAGLVGNESLLSLANDYEDGEWRYSRFGDFIWDSIQETALSQSERAAWIGSPMTMLRVAAERLRICDDNGKGSELAEIFLYGVMRRHYGALTLLTNESTDLWHKTGSGQYVWTIEHIFPQGRNIPPCWVDMIAEGDSSKAKEYRSEYVHMLGNLTITGYNSKLSNFPFEIKRDRKDQNGNFIGYRNRLNLNADVCNKDRWTVDDILARTDALARRIVAKFNIKA